MISCRFAAVERIPNLRLLTRTNEITISSARFSTAISHLGTLCNEAHNISAVTKIVGIFFFFVISKIINVCAQYLNIIFNYSKCLQCSISNALKVIHIGYNGMELFIIIIQITKNLHRYQLYTRFCSLKHVFRPSHAYSVSSTYPIKISNPCQFF